MAFSLDFSHIPAIPGLPTPAAATSGFSNVTKTLVDKITTDPGSLFSNPMINQVNLVGDGATRIERTLTGIASGDITNGSITQADAAAFLTTDPIEDVRTSMGNFMMHTDRLSGLLKSQGIQAPGLQQILSIGTSMQNMLTVVNAGKDCLAVLGGATGLFSQSTFDGFFAQLEGVASKLERGAATIADITDTLAVVSNSIRGIVDKDSQFLQNCVNQLQQAAVAMGLEALNADPCTHFLFDTVANKNPGGVLDILSNPIYK
jgi:hypothetical protein